MTSHTTDAAQPTTTGWVQDGVTPHPTGGYVAIRPWFGWTEYVDADGRRHRMDGPAVDGRSEGGRAEWWVEGRLHRIGGPAIEGYGETAGARQWFVDGQAHRVDGPAIESPGRVNAWFVNGRRHRVDGPAVEFVDGQGNRYYVAGDEMAEHEYLAWQEQRLRETPSCRGRRPLT